MTAEDFLSGFDSASRHLSRHFGVITSKRETPLAFRLAGFWFGPSDLLLQPSPNPAFVPPFVFHPWLCGFAAISDFWVSPTTANDIKEPGRYEEPRKQSMPCAVLSVRCSLEEFMIEMVAGVGVAPTFSGL